jgi:hypothetical protein
MVLHMMSYIYSHCRTEGRWLTGVNLQVRTTTRDGDSSDPGGKKVGSGINILDPPHWLQNKILTQTFSC